MNVNEVRNILMIDVPLQVLGTVDSTNKIAKEWALQGTVHGSTVIALRQTQGRGRRGRSFYSPEGGLYMSCYMKADTSNALLLTTMAATAVCKAIEGLTDIKPAIKWVNDILVNRRKVCGILTEGVIKEGLIAGAVIGIGLNIRKVQFPTEIADIAGVLFSDEQPVSTAMLAAAIITELLIGYKTLGKSEQMQEYRKRCATIGSVICFLENGICCEGKALDIDDSGGLVVMTEEGKTVLNTGEITIQ